MDRLVGRSRDEFHAARLIDAGEPVEQFGVGLGLHLGLAQRLVVTGHRAGGVVEDVFQCVEFAAAQREGRSYFADEAVYAYAFEGKRYDCGSKLGYLEATVEFGLKHENLGDQFANYLARLVADRLRGCAGCCHVSVFAGGGDCRSARGNRFLCWFLGGLNFQIEHHLFPQYCHLLYPRIRHIVKQTCEEFGVRYTSNDSFWNAIAEHYRSLREFGRQPA